MVSKPIKLPDVVDYLYSNSVGIRGMPANVGPRFGLACSDLGFMRDFCNQDLVITQFTIHKRNVGGLMESDCNIVNSAYTSKHVRYVGLFDDELECSRAFRAVAKASLGASRYKLYYGTAFRLLNDEEHESFLSGYARGIAWLEDNDDYQRTKSTISLLYHHAPFFEEVDKLTSDTLNFGPRRKYDDQIDLVLEKARRFKEKID